MMSQHASLRRFGWSVFFHCMRCVDVVASGAGGGGTLVFRSSYIAAMRGKKLWPGCRRGLQGTSRYSVMHSVRTPHCFSARSYGGAIIGMSVDGGFTCDGAACTAAMMRSAKSPAYSYLGNTAPSVSAVNMA